MENSEEVWVTVSGFNDCLNWSTKEIVRSKIDCTIGFMMDPIIWHIIVQDIDFSVGTAIINRIVQGVENLVYCYYMEI